jgi:hypothetical protein
MPWMPTPLGMEAGDGGSFECSVDVLQHQDEVLAVEA